MRTLALLAAVTAACGKSTPPARPAVPVTVAESRTAAAPFTVTANGIVEPMQAVSVQSQVQGVLLKVHFREGEEVKAGDLLFEIDPRPFEAALNQAKAGLARDVAQAANAQRDADRYAALVQKDYVTRSQADQAAANAAGMKAVVQSDSAAVANAQFNLDNANIRAPISGKTGNLFVRQGNLVRQGATPPLVVINQIHPILARFAVNERVLPLVQKYFREHPLKAVANTSQAGTGVEGTLNFIDNGVDSTTGTVTLKARFDNADNQLWPGQFVSIALELYVEPAAVLVPGAAVQTGQDGQFVFAIDAEGKARVRAVTAGRAIGDDVVIEKGLAAGTRVVTDGQSRLTPGVTVDARTQREEAAAAAPGGAPGAKGDPPAKGDKRGGRDGADPKQAKGGPR